MSDVMTVASPTTSDTCQAGARVLADAELRRELDKLPGWSVRDGRLHRELHFDRFASAFEFVAGLALLAERRNHHPSFSVEKRDVFVDLWTRKMGAITTIDADVAEEIEQLVAARL